MKFTKESEMKTLRLRACRSGLGLFFLMLVSLVRGPSLASAATLLPGWVDAMPYAINDKGEVMA